MGPSVRKKQYAADEEFERIQVMIDEIIEQEKVIA